MESVVSRRASERALDTSLMLYSYVALVATGFRFALPYVPQSRVVPIVVFVAVPLGSVTKLSGNEGRLPGPPSQDLGADDRCRW
jgi:hypothetical protein